MHCRSCCLRPSLKGALALLLLFVVQVTIAFIYRNDEATTIRSLTYLSWIYLALTAVMLFLNRRCLVTAIKKQGQKRVKAQG